MSQLINRKQGNPLTPAQRRAQQDRLVKSPTPRKSVGFSITPAAGNAEKDQRFALRRGTI